MTVRPVSFAQRRLWLADQRTESTSVYNLYMALRLRGPLNPAALHDSVRDVVRRHEILRTTFAAMDGEPYQVVADRADPHISLADLSGLTGRDAETCAAAMAEADVDRSFDLATGPLSRFTLFRIGMDDHVFALVCHHIVWDDWSAGLFMAELSTCYEAHVTGMSPELTPLPFQYSDHVARQQQDTENGRRADVVNWWRTQLAGAPILLNLPTMRPSPTAQGYAGGTVDRELEARLWHDTAALARRHRVTPFIVLLAGFAVLLSRLSSSEDVVVGTQYAGRTSTETQALIGNFVNPLPLRIDLTGNPTFEEMLRRVRRTSLDAFARQDVPLKLVIGLGRDRAHDQLLQVLFVLQQPVALPSLAGMDVEVFPLHASTTFADLWLDIRPSGDTALATFRYRTDLIDTATVTLMARRYETVLRAALDAPGTRVAALPLPDADEHDTVPRR